MDSLPAQYAPLEYDSRTDEQLVAMLDERKLSKKGGRQDWIKRMRGQDTYIENGIQALVAQDLPPIRISNRHKWNTGTVTVWYTLVGLGIMLTTYHGIRLANHGLGLAVSQAMRRQWLTSEIGITFARWRDTVEFVVQMVLGACFVWVWIYGGGRNSTLPANRAPPIETAAKSRMYAQDQPDLSQYIEARPPGSRGRNTHPDHKSAGSDAQDKHPDHALEGPIAVPLRQSLRQRARSEPGKLRPGHVDRITERIRTPSESPTILTKKQGQQSNEHPTRGQPRHKRPKAPGVSAQQVKQESLSQAVALGPFAPESFKARICDLDLATQILRFMGGDLLQESQSLLQHVDHSLQSLRAAFQKSSRWDIQMWRDHSTVQAQVISLSLDIHERYSKNKEEMEQRHSKAYRELKQTNMRLTEKCFLSTRAVTVMIRVRGRDDKDKDVTRAAIRILPQEPNTLVASSDKTGPWKNDGKTTVKRFTYEHVFGPGVSNRAVSEKLEPMIQAVLTGHNIYIIMDGQTGTGKTYTMFKGPAAIASSAVDQIFSWFDMMMAEGHKCNVTCSALQVYRGNLEDLFADAKHPTKVPPRLQRKGRLFEVYGCEVKDVLSAGHLQRLLGLALKKRCTRATSGNTESSRSHLICTINVSQYLGMTTEALDSHLILVDLAGSERLRTELQDSIEDPLLYEEIKSINAERFAFKAALRDLRSGKDPMINDPLTKTLSGCFDSKSKTVWMANVSPLREDHSMSWKILTDAIEIHDVYLSKGRTPAKILPYVNQRTGDGHLPRTIERRPALRYIFTYGAPSCLEIQGSE